MDFKCECQKICENLRLSINFDNKNWRHKFENKVIFYNISINQKLSGEFIREFRDKISWGTISKYQQLSEDFIREFHDKVEWYFISMYQKLSENFIREFKDRVDWVCISRLQKLSEEFIREFQDKVEWDNISSSQQLSENFIREFKDKVNWVYISYYQKLSNKFISEFKGKVYINVQLKNHHNKRSKEEIIKEMKLYAKKYGLKFKRDGYLYCYRQHNQFGRGIWNWTIIYNEVGKRYKDWRCNLDRNMRNSFGLGIFPEGNILVKVHWSDWGCWVEDSNKCRVFAFTLLEIN